jgi:Domain of unknown function (DUF4136)
MEESVMQSRGSRMRSLPLLAAALVLCGLFVAGCDDESLRITTDHTIPIPKHATWAWRPAPLPPAGAQAGGDNRAVTSRDVINPRGPVPSQPDPEQDAIRQRVRTAIEQQLTEKGFKQVSDPGAADFLVDYHFALHRQDVEVPRGYSGYPGLVCGPFGCYNSWGWGPPEYHYEDVHFREGTFVFDLVKSNTGARAYRAVGQEPTRNHDFTQDRVNRAIHRMLRDLKSHGG